MDRLSLARVYSEKEQNDILRNFVDAIVSAQDALADADLQDWDAILRSSVREHREESDEEAVQILSVC